MIAPRYLDQRLTGEALVALGTSVLLPRNHSAGSTASLLAQTAADGALAERAKLRSVLIHRRGIGDALAATVEAVRGLLYRS